MGMLIAVAGLAGAGKTTAIDHLESLRAGRQVYVGELVLNEVRARGLEVNPENENLVRLDLRHTRGPEAFAALVLREGTLIYIDDYFNGYSGNPNKGVAGAFREFEKYGRWSFQEFRPVGWWGKSFIAYPK